MQYRQGPVPSRRRWRREQVALTVLGRFAGGDRLGKTVNLSERGLGAVFQGRGYGVDQTLEIQMVAGGAVRRFFGVTCSAAPRGRHTRLGIRTFGYVPSDAGGAEAWAAARRSAAPRGRPPRVPAEAAWSPGAGFPLVSPGGLRAMERDRRELAEEIRARYGLRGDEPWDEVLRRFLHHLRGSPLRSRFAREQFRDAMSTRYPVPSGSAIRGRVLLQGTDREAQELPPCIIHLDHFAVASCDHSGAFAARGIPPLDDPVTVPLRIASHAVLSTSPVAVNLPWQAAACIEVDLPIVLRTTPGAAGGQPMAPEARPSLPIDLEGLLGLVDRL